MLELERNPMHDERDVAEAGELMERYLDYLQDLEENAEVPHQLSLDEVADKVMWYWYKDA